MSYIIVHKRWLLHNFVIDKIYNQIEDVFFFWNNYVNLETMFKYAIIDDKGKYNTLDSFIVDKKINKLFWKYNDKMRGRELND